MEFLAGNERIHQLTTLKPNELRICLKDVGDVETDAGYSHFYLDGADQSYKLHIDSYFGNAGTYDNLCSLLIRTYFIERKTLLGYRIYSNKILHSKVE